MKLASEVKAPKLSAAIFLWKQSQHEFDELYSDIIGQCPDFAILAAKTSARKDYRSWIFQHKSWSFSSSHVTENGNINENSIAIFVGRFGENKGETALHVACCNKNITIETNSHFLSK